MTRKLRLTSLPLRLTCCGILLIALLSTAGQWRVATGGAGAGANTPPPAAPAAGLPPFKAIAAGDGLTCGVTAAGGVLCWGNNQPAPSEVSGLDGGTQSVSVGYNHVCALTVAGGVKCWGRNDVGQLGDGSTTSRSTAVDVVGLSSGVLAIAAGYEYTCATLSGGSVKCWGQNDTCQLGDGTTRDRSTPVDVYSLGESVKSITANGFDDTSVKPYRQRSAGHTCAVTGAGDLLCWGSNSFGQLGRDDMYQACTPIRSQKVAAGVEAVAAGPTHTCALAAEGGVKCWGSLVSEFPAAISTTAAAPHSVGGKTSDVQAIAAGGSQACALTTGGGVLCWGRGILGNGSNTDSSLPQQVYGLTGGIQAVAVGYRHACALSATGEVKCWGMNFFGELGNYTLRDLWRIPVSPTYLPGEVHSVAAGGWHTCVLARGSPQAGWGVACFGENSDGQLGDGGGEWSWVLPRAAKGLDTGIEAISTGARHTCALGTAGSLRCWGDNDFGQLGDKTRDDRRTPVAVRGLSEGVVAVSAGDEQTCALVVGGRVKCWGTHYGNEPSVVDLDETTIALALGATQACALTSSAGVKCWGADTGYVPTAVDLGGDSAAAVAVGDAHACALTGVGGVKCWGSNSDGQLGDGTTVDRTAAVTVVGLASGVKAVAAGATRSCALRTGGEMVCWGAEPSHCSGWRSPVPQTISLSAGHVRTMSLGRCHTCVTLAQAETETASSPANIQCWGRNDEGELGVNNGYLPVDVITVEVRGYLPYTAKQ